MARTWCKKRQTLPKKGVLTDHHGSVSEHVEMADVGVQVKTVEADQDEANPNEVGLIHEVEVAAAALKLTDQPDDLTMIQKTLTVILTSF